MRREGKAGPFIPCEVRVQTMSVRATTPAVAHRCHRATTTVGARAKAPMPRQQRLCPGENACAWATTPVPARRRVLRGRGVFSQTPQTSALGRRRLHLGDNACVRVTTSALAQRRLDPVFLTLAFFRALAIQTKLFHYLFMKITQIVLKMVIQSYFY